MSERLDAVKRGLDNARLPSEDDVRWLVATVDRLTQANQELVDGALEFARAMQDAQRRRRRRDRTLAKLAGAAEVFDDYAGQHVDR